MGQILSLKCKKCGYESDLWIGAGMSFYSVENVMEIFDASAQEKIKKAIMDNPKAPNDVRKRIGICRECGKIKAVGVFRMTIPDGDKIEIVAKCNCGGQVRVVDSEEAIKCPKCGELLQVEETGHWD